jgi:hypothetical protein
LRGVARDVHEVDEQPERDRRRKKGHQCDQAAIVGQIGTVERSLLSEFRSSRNSYLRVERSLACATTTTGGPSLRRPAPEWPTERHCRDRNAAWL